MMMRDNCLIWRHHDHANGWTIRAMMMHAIMSALKHDHDAIYSPCGRRKRSLVVVLYHAPARLSKTSRVLTKHIISHGLEGFICFQEGFRLAEPSLEWLCGLKTVKYKATLRRKIVYILRSAHAMRLCAVTKHQNAIDTETPLECCQEVHRLLCKLSDFPSTMKLRSALIPQTNKDLLFQGCCPAYGVLFSYPGIHRFELLLGSLLQELCDCKLPIPKNRIVSFLGMIPIIAIVLSDVVFGFCLRRCIHLFDPRHDELLAINCPGSIATIRKFSAILMPALRVAEWTITAVDTATPALLIVEPGLDFLEQT